MLEIKDLKKRYGRFQALDGLSMEVGDGELYGFVGPNGAGKTTLLHILGCLDSFDSGTYLLNGKSVGKMGDRQLAAVRNREIGFVMQDFALVAQEDVLFNVMLPLYFSQTKHSRMKDLAAEKLERVGLSDQIGKKVSQLSGGQKQRVAIARALVAGSGIILADEPTGALDSGTGREVMELLRGINREQGTTVVVITHDAEVASYAGRRIVLADGVVEYDESA